MGKIHCLIGKSASGKSTIEKELEYLGLKRIISTTTREKREHEVDNIDYHYVSEVEFAKLILNGNLLEQSRYNNWNYGIDKVYNDIDLTENDYVVVIEPIGFKQLSDNIGKENIVSYYIYVDDKQRLLRSLNREDNPNCREICRRFISDIDLFKDIETKVDYIIENINVNDSVNKIIKLIK